MGQQYELGKMDCFSLILNYCDIIEYVVPEEYMGLTRETYKDLYLSSPVRAKEIMICFMQDHFEEINLSDFFTGDIALLRFNKHIFLGIASGNGTVISANIKEGVHLIQLGQYKMERVFRCRML